MKFKTLSIEVSKEAEIAKSEIPFRWFTHHIKEIFMTLLPAIEINDSRKIEISFGAQGTESVFDNVLGVTNYFIEDFDFKKFYSLNHKAKEFVVLEEVKNVLILLCKNDNYAIKLINDTINKVIESGFNLKIPITKLDKRTKDRNWKISIDRVLNAEVGEAWRYSITDKSKSTIAENWITKKPNYLNMIDFYKRADLKNEEYLIYNSLGTCIFQLNLAKFVDKENS